MPLGYSGAPRVTQSNMPSRLRRLSRSLTTGNNGTPLKATLFSNESFDFVASPNVANTNSRRDVLNIFSTEFVNADDAPVNAAVVLGYKGDCGFIELRCMNDNTTYFGIDNTFGGGPNAILYIGAAGFLRADNTAFTYDENLEQVKVYQNTANTTPMLVLENDGTGDAGINFLLSGGQGYSIGIDNDSSDRLKIVPGNTIAGAEGILMDTDGKLGFGTSPTASSRIFAYNQTDNFALTIALEFQAGCNTTTTGEHTVVGLKSNTASSYVASGQTDTGYHAGIQSQGYINNPLHQGTLEDQYGIRSEVGMVNCGVGGTINSAYGIFTLIRGNDADGTINSAYGMYIERDSSSTTVNNLYGVYVATSAMDNYFAGDTAFGAGAGALTFPTNLHVYENNSQTNPAIWIEQDGIGDACIHFRLTSTAFWTIGIDNSDGDKLKISNGTTLDTGFAIAITTSELVGVGTASPVSTFEVNGSEGSAITTVTTNTTLNVTHHTVLVNCASGAVTITLPAASGATRRIYFIKKIDSTANQMIIDANGSELIDGNTTITSNTQWEAVRIHCDGTSWYIV